VASSPLVPRNDPTLMFTNAGMVQFKNVFTGARSVPYSRATTSQKCVRAGGKHNDLDNVGYTARHHTFFEMLGNFSFGDYFKEDAIELAWNLITKEFGLPKDKLLVTSITTTTRPCRALEEDRRPADDRIIRIRTSTISGDGRHRPLRPVLGNLLRPRRHIWGGPPGSPEEDGDRFIEIWNLVFMQFEQVTKEDASTCRKPSIDTGMGLERIAAVLQGARQLRHRPVPALIAASARRPASPADGRAREPPRHRRPSALVVLPDRRRRAAVERGPRLCAAPHHAPRHAPRAAARRARAADVTPLVPALVREMGQAYPELVRAER
jgi:alanyl-tRNA synthetase